MSSPPSPPQRVRRSRAEAAQLRAEIIGLAGEGLTSSEIVDRINADLPPGHPYRITAGSVRRELGSVRRAEPAATLPPRPKRPRPAEPRLVVHALDPSAATVNPAEGRTIAEVVAIAALHTASGAAHDTVSGATEDERRFAAYVAHLEVAGPDTAAAAAGATRADIERWHCDPERMRQIRQVMVLTTVAVRRRLLDIAMGRPVPQAVKVGGGIETREAPADVRTQARALEAILESRDRSTLLYLELLRASAPDKVSLPAEQMVAATTAREVFPHMADVDLMAGGDE